MLSAAPAGTDTVLGHLNQACHCDFYDGGSAQKKGLFSSLGFECQMAKETHKVSAKVSSFITKV